MTTPPKYRKPEESPAAGTEKNLREWRKLADEAPERARTAAATWRNGLAGFVTVLLSLLVLKGGGIGDIVEPYRWVVFGGVGLGLFCAVIGLWAALSAEAPPEGAGNYDAITRRYDSLAEYLQEGAKRSWEKIAWARRCLVLSLAFILAGVLTWWLVPATPDAPAVGKVSVTWQAEEGSRTVCGSVVPSAPRTVALLPNDSSDVVIVNTVQIVELTQVGEC